MQLQLLFLTAGCFCAVQCVEHFNADDESCSMQAYHALGEPNKSPDSSVNSNLLDKLVVKSKSHTNGRADPIDPIRSQSPTRATGATFVQSSTVTNFSAPSDPQSKTNATSTATSAENGGPFHKIHVFLDSRPEVKVLLKAVLISWAIAGLLGACAVAWGKAKIYPPYKYLSWREIKDEEAKLNGFWSGLEPSTKWSLLMVLIFFLFLFFILWKMNVIQPVINQLTCYIYVFLFFGVIVSVIVTDLLGKVRKQAQESLDPVLRFLEKIEGHPFLPEASSPKAPDQADVASSR